MFAEIRNHVRDFLKREDGPTAVEYAVMLALIVALCFAAIQAVGANASKTFGTASNTLGGAAPACFVQGTLVHTPNGLIPIERIAPGMTVWSWNEQSQRFDTHEVVKLIRASKRSLIEMAVDAQQIVCTEEHPFLLADGTWKRARALKQGDRLFAKDGSRAAVASHARKIVAEPVPVFNFEVAETHTYCVGDGGLVVHNIKGP